MSKKYSTAAGGMTLEEIADEMGLKKAQVYWILQGALRKVRKAIERDPELKDLVTQFKTQ